MTSPAMLIAAEALARNVAPLFGILLLGWSARNVLYLYFVDTLLAMAVIIAGVIRWQNPPAAEDGWAARLNGEAGVLAGGVFTAAILAVPLGIWFVFMLDGRLELRETFADPAFLTAVGWQALVALASYRSLAEALQNATPDTLRLKRRFALVFLRWIALIFCSQFVAILPQGLALVALVAIYVALSTWTEIAPDHFLQRVPGGGEATADTSPVPATPPARRTKRRRQ